jgi:hypothetical protein
MGIQSMSKKDDADRAAAEAAAAAKRAEAAAKQAEAAAKAAKEAEQRILSLSAAEGKKKGDGATNSTGPKKQDDKK